MTREQKEHLEMLGPGDPPLAKCFECQNLYENWNLGHHEGYGCYHADIWWPAETCRNFIQKGKHCSGYYNGCLCEACYSRRIQERTKNNGKPVGRMTTEERREWRLRACYEMLEMEDEELWG